MTLWGRGGFFWLLGFEAMLAWRTWLSAGKMGRLARWGLFALIGVAALGCGYAAAFLLGKVAPAPSPEPIGVLVLSLAFALAATLMLSQALLASVETVYSRGDLDLLFSSPVAPWTVMMVRACGIALNVGSLYLTLVLLVLVWTPLTGATAWAVVLPSVLALSLTMTAVGLVIAKLLFTWIGPRNTRVTAQILAALIGASLFLASQAFNFVPRGERNAYYQDLAKQILAIRIDNANPLWIPARAALGDPLALTIWIAIAIASFIAAAYWFSRSFVSDAAAASAMGSRRRKADTTIRPFLGGATWGLVRKEWRLLRRDPLLLSQIGLQIVYILPLMVVIWSSAGRGADAALMNSLLGGAFVLLASSLASSLTWITASAEDAPDLIAAAPLSKRRVETGKILAAVTPVVALMVIPAIAIAMNSWLNAVAVLAAATAAALCAGYIGVWHQQPANRKDFRRQRSTSLVAGFGQTFVALSWSSAAGLALANLAIVSIIPALIGVGLTLALQDTPPSKKAPRGLKASAR